MNTGSPSHCRPAKKGYTPGIWWTGTMSLFAMRSRASGWNSPIFRGHREPPITGRPRLFLRSCIVAGFCGRRSPDNFTITLPSNFWPIATLLEPAPIVHLTGRTGINARNAGLPSVRMNCCNHVRFLAERNRSSAKPTIGFFPWMNCYNTPPLLNTPNEFRVGNPMFVVNLCPGFSRGCSPEA